MVHVGWAPGHTARWVYLDDLVWASAVHAAGRVYLVDQGGASAHTSGMVYLAVPCSSSVHAVGRI